MEKEPRNKIVLSFYINASNGVSIVMNLCIPDADMQRAARIIESIEHTLTEELTRRLSAGA